MHKVGANRSDLDEARKRISELESVDNIARGLTDAGGIGESVDAFGIGKVESEAVVCLAHLIGYDRRGYTATEAPAMNPWKVGKIIEVFDMTPRRSVPGEGRYIHCLKCGI